MTKFKTGKPPVGKSAARSHSSLVIPNGEAVRNLLIACGAHAASDKQIPPSGRNDKI
jgi:hypothetical protein